jgi:hypothetical protein
MPDRLTACDRASPRDLRRSNPAASPPTLGSKLRLAAGLLLVALVAPAAIAAQVTDTTGRSSPSLIVPKPTGAPPITPRRAFLYSLAAPGSGQSILGRPTAGSIFVAAEAGALAMIAKSVNDLRAARAIVHDSVVYKYAIPTGGTVEMPVRRLTAGALRAQSRIPARRAHVEDWIAILIVNHFFAGADAYVAANLWDVPTDVSVSPAHAGGIQLRASLAW